MTDKIDQPLEGDARLAAQPVHGGARMSQPHENLIAWQRADDLCLTIYRTTHEHFPKEEKYGLTAQIRRASYSIAANIVEGYADSSRAWRLRYLRIAVGSLAEVGYFIHLALGWRTYRRPSTRNSISPFARLPRPCTALSPTIERSREETARPYPPHPPYLPHPPNQPRSRAILRRPSPWR